MINAREINWAAEARELKHAIADNAYPAEDGTADIDNHALPLIETTLRDLCERYIKSRMAAGYRILGPDEVDPVTVEKCAVVVERMLRFADTTSEADIAILEAIRALKQQEPTGRSDLQEKKDE